MLTIYFNNVCEYIDEYKNDILDTLKSFDIEPTEENIQTEAQCSIDSDFEELKAMLNSYDIKENKKIIVYGELGLWHSKPTVKKIFDSLFNAVMYCLQDDNTLFFKSDKTTLQLNAIHHDGTNKFKFYKLIKGKKYAIKYDDIYL